MQKDCFRRESEFNTRAASGDTVELSFSSELAVDRGSYREILSHDPADVDLSRLNDAHPLLLNHDPSSQIGVVERAWIGSDRKGRARVRFSKSQLGREVLQDVKDGIRKLVSVGYKITRQVSREIVDGVETIRFAWQPYEVSVCSTPQDGSVGIGRSSKVERTSVYMQNSPQLDAQEIMCVAKNLRGKLANNIDPMDLATEAISRGLSVADFRAECLKHLPTVTPLQRPLMADVKPRDWARYSVTRALASVLDGGRLDGLERELSDEISMRSGTKPQGFWLPQEVANRNFIAGTGTLGGHIVETSNLGDQFVELLRNQAQVQKMGARVLTLNNPVTIPRQAAAGGVNWVGETVAATLSTGNFEQFTLTPHAVTAYQQYGKQLLVTSSPDIESLVRADINAIINTAIDYAALHGAGTAEPVGISNTTGVSTVGAYLTAAGLTATLYPFLVSLEAELADSNADGGAMGYLMRPKERSACKTNTEFPDGGISIWKGGQEGVVNGYRALCTNQLSATLTTGTATTICTAVFFGNWNDVLIGKFAGGATDLVVDQFSLAPQGVVRLVARAWVDVALRHPESFALGYVLA